MLKLSKKVEYALISMCYMAKRDKGQLTTTRELSENFNFSQELIGKVLQSLTKNGFVTSVQGVKGGYELAQEPESINITGVINAVDGPVRVVSCIEEGEDCTCEQLSFCNIRNPMETIQLKLIHFFDTITLQDLQSNQIPFEVTSTPDKGDSIPVNFVRQLNKN